jgi:hypothetical protein
LDAAVKAVHQAKGDTKGPGRPLELPEIEPWTEPVNGEALRAGAGRRVREHARNILRDYAFGNILHGTAFRAALYAFRPALAPALAPVIFHRAKLREGS